jgi:diguanylate cyclase (GGDEF)-like protein
VKTPAESLAFRQSLLEILQAGPRREETLLEQFERRKGPSDPLYSSLLYLLTHLDFSERRATRHWKRILEHRQAMHRALGRDPGLRVAIFDYFVNVCGELRNPMLIELASYERTERSAVSDGLTGLYNHAFFLQALRQELLRSRRHGRKTALLLLDLDDFKRVNDQLGHVEGDRALMKAAAVVRDSLREIDVAARYGGEEFAVLLPETARLGAFVVAERIRRGVLRRFARARPALTVSGGIAVYPDDAATPADLIVRADAGLYGAKAAGKNRIVLPRGERRRHLRHQQLERVTVCVAGATSEAPVKDVSEGGLLVRLSQAVALGSAVNLVIEHKHAQPFALRGEVVRVERVPGGAKAGFDVGVRFLELGVGSEGPARA